MTAPAPPASTSQALGMLTSALSYLTVTPATQMPAEVQAQCLITLERADARTTAARASILAAFTATQGYRDDGDYSSRSWLIHHTRVTRATAADHAGWSGRTRTHPRILAALAAADISRSYARAICAWTGRLPGNCCDNADAILVSAAQMGMELPDLAALAAEIEARSRPDTADEDGLRFEDRAVKLETTFGGAGVMSCFFHHAVMIHRMGWTLVRNPDGTTTAWNRDRTKVLRSHSPPARAG